MYKKILAVLLTVVMGISMVACGDSDSKDGNKKASESEVKLADYKGLVVYEDDITATDEYINQQLDTFLASCKVQKDVSKVKENDTVNIDYKGEIVVEGKKVAFEGGSAEKQEVVASDTSSGMIEGFASSMVGHKVGDKYTANLKFPEDYGKSTKVDGKDIDLSGMKVDFTITVNSVKRSTTPKKLTDAVVKENAANMGYADVKNIKQLKKTIKEQYKNNEIMNIVWQDFYDACEVTYSDSEVESICDAQKSAVESQYTINFDQYLEMASASEDDFTESIKNSIKSELVLRKIAENEKYDIDKEMKSMAEQNDMDVDTMNQYYQMYYGTTMENAMLMSKVQEVIVKNAEIKKGSNPEKETTAEETTAAK